ncbi:MAG: hypothetical protein JW863_14580 [Chitinispirillaceae bacterium]|nr:hypothetical protein [Chitinispirillaceae bacterium]
MQPLRKTGRRFVIINLALSGALFTGCVQFPTQYERIEPDRIRLLDFMYEPPEALPGDTVTLRAVFAGKPVNPEDISWRVSWKVVRNAMGIDTSFEEQPLVASVEPFEFSRSTSGITLRFAIPENCIAESPMVPDDWLSLLPDELRGGVPEPFASMSKEEILDRIDSLRTEIAALEDDQLEALGTLIPDLVANLPLAMQLLTVPVRLFADVKGEHRIQSDYTVSYTSAFARWPGANVFENTNPRIDSAGVYKVEGVGLARFDPEDENTEYIPFSINGDADTTRIPVDKGYSYFVKVFTGRRDTVYTLGDMMQGVTPSRTEEHTAEWLFRMEPDEMEDLSTNDLMNVGALGDFEGMLLPPRSKSIRHFTLWVQVTDSKIGIINRSQGSTVAEMQGLFEYTDAYLDQFKK